MFSFIFFSPAFWLQGRPADFLALSQTPLAIVQDPNNSSLVTALIEATPPPTSSVNSRELKLAHRNQTIYETSCSNTSNANNTPNFRKHSLNSVAVDEDYEMAAVAPLPPPRHRPTSLKFVGAPNVAAAQAATAVAKPCPGQFFSNQKNRSMSIFDHIFSNRQTNLFSFINSALVFLVKNELKQLTTSL
jgi:hypothetical protein